MIYNLTKQLRLYYQIVLFLIITAISLSFFYFWKEGFLDGSRGEKLHLSSFIVEKYQEENPIKEIKNLIFEENTKNIVGKINNTQSEFKKINTTLEFSGASDLNLKFEEAQKLAAALVNFPKSNSVISVLTDKVSKFNNFVRLNNWKTLTRNSDQVYAVLQGYISKKNLKKIVSKFDRDFNQMEEITKNSILTRADKAEIISRIQNLKVETKMLTSYLNQRDELIKSIDELEKEFNPWLESISPEIALQKLDATQIGKTYVFVLLGLFSLSGLFFGMSFFLTSFFSKKSQKKLESFLEEYVSSTLMNPDYQNINGFTEKFNEFSHQTANYLSKRMSFGGIFQEALPISSLLLDKNLKVIWANRIFTESWKVSEDETHSGLVSWDFLSQFTNLGSSDPVLDALKFGIAGIYQIQVKTSPEETPLPYEMYVSPVKVGGTNNVMLFFYPLFSLQQTIRDQVHSIITPINKSLSLLLENKSVDSSHEDLRREFEMAGASLLFNMFSKLSEKINKEEERLKDLLLQKDNLISSLHSDLNDFEEKRDQISENGNCLKKELLFIKENLISFSNMGNETQEKLNRVMKEYEDVLHNYERCLSDNASLSLLSTDFFEKLPSLSMIKDGFKSIRSEFTESKSSLSHSISSLIHFKKKIEDSELKERFSHTVTKIGEEFRALDEKSILVDKKLMNLEVTLSKLEMLALTAQTKIEELTHHSDKEFLMDSKRSFMKMKNLPNFSFEEVEESAIKSMHVLYHKIKENIELSFAEENYLAEIQDTSQGEINSQVQ